MLWLWFIITSHTRLAWTIDTPVQIKLSQPTRDICIGVVATLDVLTPGVNVTKLTKANGSQGT